jgi:lipoyl(octanoyl) transferase
VITLQSNSKFKIQNSKFRLLDTSPAPGAWNMALDAALMDSVRAGGAPVLRFYRWSPCCLSLGRNQPARERYDLEALRARGFEVVRRPTGGRAVLHDRELTYSVILPDSLLGGPRRSYATINRALVRGLRRLGVAAELQPRGRRAAVPSLLPCFREPAEGEVVVGGRKLVGSAQFRERHVLLQHGSLLLENDQATVGGLLREPSAAEPPDDASPATLRELLGAPPSWKTLTRALAKGWTEELRVRLLPAEPSPQEEARATELAVHYADPAWTWRI